MLVLAPESAGGIDPAGNGLDADGFGEFVHQDFFFAHGDSLAAISRQGEGTTISRRLVLHDSFRSEVLIFGIMRRITKPA